MKNKILMLLGVLTLAGFTSVFASKALAYRGDPSKMGPNYSPERHEAVETAFDTSDYNAWKTLMGDRGVTQKINESNFARFAQAHRLAEEGKLEEAKAIRQELGLGLGGKMGKGLGGNGNCQSR